VRESPFSRRCYFGEHIHRTRIIGTGFAFHDACNLAELAAYFIHHCTGCTTNGHHCHAAKEVWQQSTQ